MSQQAVRIERDVPLAPLTTLGVGGAASAFARVHSESELREVLARARSSDTAVTILGGGSNVVVSDDGVAGLVVQYAEPGWRRIAAAAPADSPDAVDVEVAAGECWDTLVAQAVAEGWAGVECLSGIPGWAGAAPIQNIGAYGQEVASVLTAVRVMDTDGAAAARWLSADACGLCYRDSHFKAAWAGRHVITAIRLRLRRGGAATLAYKELRDALSVADGGAIPSLSTVRETVLALRRRKSMVLDTRDPNSRSVGSFFTNPVVDAEQLQRVRDRVATHTGRADTRMPSFAAGPNSFKLSAAWLMEAAGFAKGMTRGNAGISAAHALALINRGGASAAEIAQLASQVSDGVSRAFGVQLRPEPQWLGAAPPAPWQRADTT